MTQEKPLSSLFWLPLESYSSRYTELMSSPDGWTQKRLSKHFHLSRVEPPEKSHPTVISSGKVLDRVNRPLWALEQIKQLLIRCPGTGQKVLLDDFFHPGVESLPYSGREFRLFSFCWAQTFDCYDFTREMIDWMRPYEAMMMSISSGVFVASPLLRELIVTVFPTMEDRIHVVGLPFDSASVAPMIDPDMQPEKIDVVFSSRFDREKQPGFFLDLVEANPDIKFAICTGRPQLTGDAYAEVGRARQLVDQGKLVLYENLTKPEYYSVLRASKVQFNCLGGETLVLTQDGAKPIRHLVGKQKLMTEHGKWVDSEIRSYGKQKLLSLTFGRGPNSSFKIRATAKHRWYLANGRVVTSDQLRHGDMIAQVSVSPTIKDQSVYLKGVQHGIVFGDGTKRKQGGYAVRLCGDKKELLAYFKGLPRSYPPTSKGDPHVYLAASTTLENYKEPPITNDTDYLLGFFRGWLATDGSVSSFSRNVSLSGEAHFIEWARTHAALIGWHPTGVRRSSPRITSFGISTTKTLGFYSDTITEDDILAVSKREAFSEKARRSYAYVFKSAAPDEEEEVFCATVPGTNNFVLVNGMLTGNCSLQDWVSFTLLEALTHGCIPVYPNFRDFSNVFVDNSDFLYSPGSREHAEGVIRNALNVERSATSALFRYILDYHDHTYDRIADIISR